MKEKRFLLLMNSIGDDLLEEAQFPVKRWPFLYDLAGIAACLCILAAGIFMLRGGAIREDGGQEEIVSQIGQMGYDLPLPKGAEEPVYSTVDMDMESGGLAAQVTYLYNGHKYTCRVLKTEYSVDISGMDEAWDESIDWKAGGLDMQLREAKEEHAAWVGWYSAEKQMQWCLSSYGEEALSLLHTAQEIVEKIGFQMDVAPEGAEDIIYNAFTLDGLTVAETCFTLDGIRYSYRMAATYETSRDFADISGAADAYKVNTDAEVSWCPARLSYTEGGSGKIVWFDVVPGILYSLSMDDGASADALTGMAAQIFAPAQGDAP